MHPILMPPIFMHLDIDAFFPSVEQSRLPFLRNRPVVVGSGVIASCSYEARAFGLRAGMALHEARRLCPQAVYLEGDAKIYQAFAEKVWACCRDLAPAVDTYLDDAYLDMTGTHRLYPDLLQTAALLKQRVLEDTGLVVTIGVGPSRVAARLAGADAKPDGIRVISPGELRAFLDPKPVRALLGVGSKMAHKLRLLGVRTVGEMRALPLEGLQQLFGRNGEVLFARCRGRDGRLMSKREIPRTISRETTLHHASTDPEEIRSMLYYLIERAMRSVRQLGIQARTLGLRLVYSDWVARSGQRSSVPFDLEGQAFDLALRLLKTLHQRRVSLRRVGVVLSGLVPGDGDQGLLFGGREGIRNKQLARAIDGVRSRFGFKAVIAGPAAGLMNKLRWGEHGYVLRTPSLTK